MFDDVYYTPISIRTLSDKILNLIDKDAKGIFNISSNERITKYELGLMIASAFNYSTNLIIPTGISQVSNLTLRPKDMSLSNTSCVL